MRPNQVDQLSSKAIRLLEKAIISTPCGDYTLADVLSEAKEGKGVIHLILYSNSIYGVSYIVYGMGHNGLLQNIVLLSGHKIKLWKDAYHDYVVDLAKQRNCKEICVIGRSGWSRIFSDLKPIGTIYSRPIS